MRKFLQLLNLIYLNSLYFDTDWLGFCFVCFSAKLKSGHFWRLWFSSLQQGTSCYFRVFVNFIFCRLVDYGLSNSIKS